MNIREEAYDDFILGQDSRCTVSTDCRKTQLNNNIMVVGGSGSGKTTSIVIPNLLHLAHSNAVGVFTKWGMIREVSRVLQRRGYHVSIINFVEPEKSRFGYDPLSYCETEADIKQMAQAIIHEVPGMRNQTHDPYWNNAAESILIPVLRYVRNGHYKEGSSMKDALKLLDTLVVKESPRKDGGFFEVFEEDDKKQKKEQEQARKKEAEDKIYLLHKEFEHLADTDLVGNVAWASFLHLSNSASATASCVVNSLQVPLQGMFQPDIRRILANRKKFDFRKLMMPRTALFVYLSPVNMSHHRFVGLFYQQLFKALFELAERQPERRLPHPVHVFCDDFATGCHVPDFAGLISIFREKGISSIILLQSESQLEGMYGHSDARTIINNCDTYIYLGGMDYGTCEQVALRMNRSIADVLWMPLGMEVFFRRGQKPIVTKRYDLFTDPVYLGEVLGTGQEKRMRDTSALEFRKPGKERP